MTTPTPTRRLAVPLLLLALPAAAPGADAAPIRITGTGSAIGLLERVSRAFEQAHPGSKVQLLPSVGSAGAIRAVAAGALDVGLSGRELQPDERQAPVRLLGFARTPFLFAAAPGVAVRSLTAAEVVRIYRGQQIRWAGGERIRLVLRPRADADTAFLRAISPEMAAAVDAAQGRPGMLVATTNQECDQTVATTPGGLGPSTLAQLLTEPRGLQPLAWEGVEPTLANLAAGRYPLSKPLYLVLPRAPSPAVRELVAFLGSPGGRRLLEESGCLPLPLPPLD
ncbi:MAG: substrate-binding domain-containing protein [Deltaproteobacteria bacterium]|nr:substrate-binding domain-containing protein [Deltaproteobacteria bacterium]